MFKEQIYGFVEALESELNYYKRVSLEQKEIIEQLHRGYPLPGKPVYIHPYDFAEILNSAEYIDVLDVFVSQPVESLSKICRIHGVSYKQSPFMPQITKNFK